jgi:2-polyprenyl-6-methoxyphenol hydroxylase-like FAD-dependent oxidoreductase
VNSNVEDTQVLVVGGGPVGLTLAIDLGRHGIRCILIDRRPQPDFLPKMELCNARTMEIYGRLDLAETIRSAGYPADAAMDVVVATSLNEEPLLRLSYPSVPAMQALIRSHNDGYWPREAYQRISQYTLEPILKRVAEETPHVPVRFGCTLTSLREHEGGVTAQVTTADGKSETVRAAYLAGCDGASSTVRRELGIALEGGVGGPLQSQIFFRSDDLLKKHPLGAARHYPIASARRTVLITQDDLRYYSVHINAEPAVDPVELIHEIVGAPVEVEIIRVGQWRPSLLVAESYGSRRVFLLGDAAHQYIPTGGFGMNTGIGDAYDLAWKLRGALEGWGGDSLLASYAPERRPIGKRNCLASEEATIGSRDWRAAFDPSIRDNTEEGRRRRAALIQRIDVGQRKSHEMHGIELGYRYVGSPIIWPEPGEGPDPDNRRYEPTTWPGARLPHLWLADGTALHDKLGDGYTVLALGTSPAEAERIAAPLRALGAPVAVLDLDDPHVREVYGCNLLLLRPDLHIVWRGDRVPDDPARLAAIATGQAV